jgi:flagellar hook-associated protein 3 FlgL
MRITQHALTATSLRGLNRNLDAIGRLQEQLTSGRSINKPSDSPTGTNRAMQTRTDAAAATQHARNISDGQAWLQTTDSTLQSMLVQTRKVRDLTVQASNTGAVGETAALNIKTEIDGLRQSLLGLANTVVQGRPIFGGVTGGALAYDGSGQFVGRTGAEVTRRVSDSQSIRIDISGAEAFGVNAPTASPPTSDLFAVIDQLSVAVGARDSAGMAAGLSALDATMNRMLTAAADVGTRAARMDSAAQVNQDLQLTLSSQLADVENVDLPRTIMELQMQQTGYEAALGATAKVIQPSLLDFLR